MTFTSPLALANVGTPLNVPLHPTQLYEAGAFERMPDAIGHGIVAIERAGDAAWIAMRDVGDQLLPLHQTS